MGGPETALICAPPLLRSSYLERPLSAVHHHQQRPGLGLADVAQRVVLVGGITRGAGRQGQLIPLVFTGQLHRAQDAQHIAGVIAGEGGGLVAR
jgi:hypothetical protein